MKEIALKLKSNIYFMLLYRLLLVLLIYSFLRLLFYYINIGFFPDVSPSHLLYLCIGGIRFDISAILVINLIYILAQSIPFHFRHNKLYQKTIKILFIVSNIVPLASACLDLVFFPFTLRRTTLANLKEFTNDTGNTDLMQSFFVDYWWILLILLVLSSMLIFCYGSIKQKDWQTTNNNYYGISSIIFLFTVGLIVFGIRGCRTTGIPLAMNHAGKYINKPLEVAVVLNTPFCILRTLDQKNINNYNFFSEEKLENLVNPIHKASKKTFNPKNVVIILLESFGKAHSEYMPFLDSLAREGLSFKHSYANGLNSTDALPSVLAGIPALMPIKYVSSVYSNNRLDGIARQLSRKGYDCSFYHGAPRGSMRFYEFTRMLDFPNYYGREDFNNENEYDGHWGIWDEPFLQYTAEMINKKKQPSLSVIFTLTSHHPFRIPEKYKEKFPEGELPIHKTIAYSDNALREFFKTASKMPWYKNTLFVLSADHTNGATQEEYKTTTGIFSIPIIFFDPSNSLKDYREKQMVQQIDIIPSIMDYLNYDEDFFSFGESVFTADSSHFLINYSNNTYQILQNGYVLQTNEIGPKALYLQDDDPLHKNNLIDQEPERVEKMNLLYRAFIQQYNNRMINNKLNILH